MMNRNVMSRQMFAKGGAAFPDLSGDGKVTQKDILMGRGVLPMAEGGDVPGDVRAIFQGLVDAMRGSKSDVAAYVRNNSRDLSDIAQMYPNMAPMINEGFKVTSEVPMQEYFPPGYGESPESLLLMQPMQPEMDTSREEMDDAMNQMRRMEELEQGEQMLMPQPPPGVMEEMPSPAPYVPMQMGGEPMAAAMEAGAMPAEPMAAMGAPPPADLGSMDAAGIAAQMDPNVVAILEGAANNFSDPEQADTLEGMMNAVRGTRASEEERRSELAAVVGPEDAAETPDSVLALVQPVMLLLGAEGTQETEVDTGGIGPMAQGAMNVPVSGDMAGGIMQMAAALPAEGGVPPVNFSEGGEVRRFFQGGSPVLDVDATSTDAALVPVSPTPTRLPSISVPDLSTIKRPAVNFKSTANGPSVPDVSTSLKFEAPKAATLAEELKARQEIYNKLLGRDDQSLKDDRMLQFYSDLAKAGAAFAQAPKPGQSVLSQLSESLTSADIIGGQAKLKASERASKQAKDLAALSAAEKSLEADKAFRYRMAESSFQGAQSLLKQANQQKFEAGLFVSKSNQEKDLLRLKADLEASQAEVDAQRGLLSKAQLSALDAKFKKQLAEVNSNLQAVREEASDERAMERLGVQHVNALGIQGNELTAKEKEYKAKFKQEDKILASKQYQEQVLQESRESHAYALQQNELRLRQIEGNLRQANEEQRIELEKQRVKLLEEKNQIARSAAKLENASNIVGDPKKYLPVALAEKRVVVAPNGQQKSFATIELFGANKLDPTSSRLINSSLVNMYKGKKEWSESEGRYKYVPGNRLSKENEKLVLARHRIANDVDPFVISAIKASGLYGSDEERQSADAIEVPSNLEKFEQDYGLSTRDVLDRFYTAAGSEGAAADALNRLVGTIGKVAAEETAEGVAMGRSLESVSILSLLNMHPSSKPPLLFQQRMEKNIPKVGRLGDARTYANRSLALASLFGQQAETAKKIMEAGQSGGIPLEKGDYVRMRQGILSSESAAKDWRAIANYILTKEGGSAAP